jgi:hypothetical protein
MEIAMMIGMIAAFFAGAYVRKPFSVVKKEKIMEEPQEKSTGKPSLSEQLENMLSYDGKPQGGMFE